MKNVYQNILSAEPRFRVIQQELESLLQLIDLESDGEVAQVTGFRIKNLQLWRSLVVDTPLDALGALSGACNCRCVFCFEREHPFPQDKSMLSLEEAITRLRYYDPESGKSLFPANRVFKETFVNPQALPILSLARKRVADQIFWLTSNGSALSEDVVIQLAELMPVVVKLSLNSADPQMRGRLMGEGKRSKVAIQAPAHLHRYGIPFIGSLVAWPSLVPDDLVATLHHLDQFEPYALRVRLPIYHRYLHPTAPFADNLWSEVIELCREVRSQLASPLYLEPSFYQTTPIIPEVDGVIRNSPAASANINAGDRILAIDGEKVFTRCQALGLLVQAHRQRRSQLKLQIQRAGATEPDTIIIALNTGRYPYSPDIFAPGERYGMLFLNDFRIHYVEQICRLMLAHESRHAMLFTSPVVAPIVRMVLENLPPFQNFFQDRTLVIEVLQSTIVGGNFHLMDGRLVVDFVNQVEQVRTRLGELPDLIFIPVAFGNPWGIDYFQVSYKEIERRFGVPVELIDWPILYGKDV